MSDRVRLLVVDDRPENLVAMEALLAGPGVELVMAASGSDALRFALRNDFALVLLDVQMPDMDGFETAELMRANPKTRHLPIIFVTAGVKDTRLLFKGYELGAVDYLIKPFEPHILLSKVNVFCDLYRQRQQLEANQILLESKIRERVAQLRESEERFRLLATHAAVGIYQIDAEGRCIFVNPRWCELAGLSPEEADGPGWSWALHPDDREKVAESRRQAQLTGNWSLEYRYLTPDGKVTWVHDKAVALRDESGEITGYLGNNWDITQRKRDDERESTRAAVMDQLACGAPLAAILASIAAGAERQAPGAVCSIVLDEPGGQRSHGSDGERTHEDGASHWLEPVRAVNGDVLGIFTLKRPRSVEPDPCDAELMRQAARLAGLVIERKRAESELQIAASVHQAISEGIIVTDADNHIIAVNPAFSRITGYEADEVLGRTPRLLQSGQHDAAFYERLWHSVKTTGQWQGEIWNRRKCGELYPAWLSINTTAEPGGRVQRHIALFSDITKQKRAEETIWRQANYDPLTDLPNRRLFRDRLQQEIVRARRTGRYVAVLFIDLDRFKDVNDTLGHHVGDLLLTEAAQRIGRCVRASDTVARLGGDEFTVIMSDLDDVDCVSDISRAILGSLSAPYPLGPERAHISASIGITIFPTDADNVENLLKTADQAMYASKELGRNCFSYFTGSMHAQRQTRLQLGNELRGAIAAGQLELYLQPIVDLADGRTLKAEALLRWRHPARGMIDPIQFIPIAEESSLINELGDWVFRESALAAKRWYDAAQATESDLIQISVNKSPRQFLGGNTEEIWIDYLNEIGLPSSCIAIEITEGLLLDDRPETARKLTRFRDNGIRLCVDDFGTGYSAMSYLRKFPVDFLKIDRSFVRDMANNRGAQAIVEAIVVMSHKLGLKVIAEGIETAEQCELLKAAGCDYGQGFLFARPMPADDMFRHMGAGRCFAHSGWS